MRTVVLGTSGQLAIELRRVSPPLGVELISPHKIDIADTQALEQWLDQAAPQLVINAAAYTAVDRAETERERAFAVNAQGPQTLARWCARHDAALVHVSTDYVFDGSKPTAYEVDDATGPINVYGASKLAGEQAVRTELERHLMLRTSWVFSAHGQNFVKTMLRLARERDELRVVADQSGRPTPAAELARAIWAATARLVGTGTLDWGTFHVAGSGATTWHAFAEAIIDEQAAATGRRPRVVPIGTNDYPTPARRPQSSVLETSMFERAFDVQLAPWRDGLRSVVRELVDAT